MAKYKFLIIFIVIIIFISVGIVWGSRILLNKTGSVNLDNEFVINLGNPVQIIDEDLKIKAVNFHKYECPEFVSCVGDLDNVELEFTYNTKKVTEKIYSDVFFVYSYRIDILDTDYKSFAKLKVEKSRSAYARHGRLNDYVYIVKNQELVINSENLSVKLLEFYNSPCPDDAMCLWSGVGVALEISKDQQTVKKQYVTDSAIAFGYRIEMIDSDFTTYLQLQVTK